MEHHGSEQQVNIVPADKNKIFNLWKVAGILLAITILEFVVAFTLPHEYHTLRVAIFVAMTIVKAFYIVGEFMHLNHESKLLIWSILLPMIFVAWLLVALIYEGFKLADVNFLGL